jgi:curved DNA-binding protein CbpA
MRDPYELLAVPRSATADDIKKSFRKLAKKLHPDANNNDPKAAALFADLNAAYAILGNQEKRSAFDRGGIDSGGKPRRPAVSHATRRHRFTSSLWHVVTCLVIAVLIPVATLPLIIRGLTPQAQINPNAHGKHRVLSGLGSNKQHARIGQNQQPDRGNPSDPRLILRQTAARAAGDTIPLGAQVIGGAVGLALEISDIPTGMTISSGRAMAAGRWRIPAKDIGNAMIQPPSGFGDTVDLAVELRLADDTIVDRGSLRLQWPRTRTVTSAPIESAGGTAVSDDVASKAMASPPPVDQNAIPLAVESQLDREQIELLMARSQQLISQGDIGAARTLLQRAAEAREARAALALGATYDPIMLSILNAQGVAADPSLARDWYKKAGELGSQEALERLKLLTSAKIGGAKSIGSTEVLW